MSGEIAWYYIKFTMSNILLFDFGKTLSKNDLKELLWGNLSWGLEGAPVILIMTIQGTWIFLIFFFSSLSAVYDLWLFCHDGRQKRFSLMIKWKHFILEMLQLISYSFSVHHWLEILFKTSCQFYIPHRELMTLRRSLKIRNHIG